jgi:hypothetical protein
MITKGERYGEILAVLARHGIGVFDDQFIKHESGDQARAEHLRRACEELGTMFIKLGQALSTRGDLLPDAYRKELAKLQWVMGDATTHDRLVRELAVGANATVVFLDYDRAPEHRYPVAIEEAHAATCYVTEHPEEFEVDATRLAVAGDSVGGNMATVVCLLSKQRSGPRIAGELLFYPVTNADFESGSYNNSPMAPGLPRQL